MPQYDPKDVDAVALAVRENAFTTRTYGCRECLACRFCGADIDGGPDDHSDQIEHAADCPYLIAGDLLVGR